MNTWKLTSILQQGLQVAPEDRNVNDNERVVSSAIGAFLVTYALRRFGKGGLGLLFPAGYLLYRGISGYCPISASIGRDTTGNRGSTFRLRKSITINCPHDEVYSVWRDLEKLPLYLKHIKKVEKIDEKTYRWTAEFSGQEFTWTAVITEDIPNRILSWRSVEPTDVENHGSVEFNELPGTESTRFDFNIFYRPAKTEMGSLIANVLTPVFKQKIRDDLRKFRDLVEIPEPQEIYDV